MDFEWTVRDRRPAKKKNEGAENAAGVAANK